MSRERIQSIDLLRGVVMVLMALDHVRDYFTATGQSPTDLQHTTPALFMTRWVTHFCAPVFIFLAGTGAYLSKKPRGELARFLVSRGLFLVVLELTVMRFGWMFTFDYHRIFFITLWAIGWSMVALGGLVLLPFWAVVAVSVIMIVGHNALDGVHGGLVWSVLHERGRFEIGDRKLFVGYPLIPWIGVMGAGYAFGAIAAERKKILWLGAVMTVGFVLMRATNWYGDPHPWSHQASATFTVLSFLNCEKYPPSLLYLLMTLGPALLLLGAMHGVRVSDVHPLAVFGRVPMFYYILHIYLIHLASVAFFFPRLGSAVLHVTPGEHPAGFGVRLAGAYLAWVLVVSALYLPCLWYARLKRRSRSVLLSYL